MAHENTGGPSILQNMMEKIITQSQQKSGDQEIDGTSMSANGAIENYLSQPLQSINESTYHYWKTYGNNGDKTQKCLANIARRFLTPPPTSTDVERLFREDFHCHF